MMSSGLLGADSIIFDLEDAVAPDQKDAARVWFKQALTAWISADVRGSSASTRWIRALGDGLRGDDSASPCIDHAHQR